MLDEYKAAAAEYIDGNGDFYRKISDMIWDEPELSLKEHKAARLYCGALESLGFQVRERLCGIDTAFCGVYGSGGPVIGILGEFDALSGLSQQAGCCQPSPIEEGGSGHGCGHNLLGAGALAAAAAVKDYLERSGRPGRIVFFGCPGEEGGSGKAYMARERLWQRLDAALSWHPSDVNQVKTGTNNSCIQVLYKFSGVAAHAAGEPHMGRSALDAVELMNIGVQFLREHMTDDCRIHYAIVDSGGISPNVVQARASVLYMVRANRVADTVKLQARVDDIARGAALMTGTDFERVFIDGTAELLPNYTLERLLYKNFALIGPPPCDEEALSLARQLRGTYPSGGRTPGLGAGHDATIEKQVRQLSQGMTKPVNDFLMPPYSGQIFSPGSTDLGDVSWQTPTGQIEAVTWPADVPGHSWQVVACGKSSLAYSGMLTAAKVLAAAAIELFEDGELLSQARQEFSEKSASGYVCPIEPGAVPTAI